MHGPVAKDEVDRMEPTNLWLIFQRLPAQFLFHWLEQAYTRAAYPHGYTWVFKQRLAHILPTLAPIPKSFSFRYATWWG